MDKKQMNCASTNIEGNNLMLCKPLQSLKDEHGPLRALMEELYEASIEIGNDSSVENWVDQLVRLRKNVIIFVQKLEPHSEYEEGLLFPMIANYIGSGGGPIAVMEYEHDQAKLYLKTFLDKTTQLKSKVKEVEVAKSYADLVTQAYVTLASHFMKEENVLFPMAERLLTDQEKEELMKKMTIR